MAAGATMSEVLGYISIASWLGAQFPCVARHLAPFVIIYKLTNTTSSSSIVRRRSIQYSQLIVNAQLQSVEGLALPFLANWFFGPSSLCYTSLTDYYSYYLLCDV